MTTISENSRNGRTKCHIDHGDDDGGGCGSDCCDYDKDDGW